MVIDSEDKRAINDYRFYWGAHKTDSYPRRGGRFSAMLIDRDGGFMYGKAYMKVLCREAGEIGIAYAKGVDNSQ